MGVSSSDMREDVDGKRGNAGLELSLPQGEENKSQPHDRAFSDRRKTSDSHSPFLPVFQRPSWHHAGTTRNSSENFGIA